LPLLTRSQNQGGSSSDAVLERIASALEGGSLQVGKSASTGATCAGFKADGEKCSSKMVIKSTSFCKAHQGQVEQEFVEPLVEVV
jgi:hypothetical protein